MKPLLLLALLSSVAVAQAHDQIMQQYVDYTFASLSCVQEISRDYPDKHECERYIRLSNKIIVDPDYMEHLRELEAVLPSISIQDLYRYSVYIDNYYKQQAKYHY